ncbi:MAG: hypothetical protein ABL930_07985 [Pseudobdellovibrio sp.]
MIQFFAVFFLSLNLFAGELYQQGLPTRCLGMGGTCVSHIRGARALFLNPAALARVEGFDFIIAQAQAGISKDVLDFSSQFQGGSFAASDINNLYGKFLTADVTGRASFVIPNFGFGVYSNNYTAMQFSDPTFPTFNMNFISDYGYIIGGSIPLDDKTSFGLTLRHIKRWGGQEDIGVASIIGSSSNNIASDNFQDHGVGHAVDLAFMKTFDHALKPTLSLVWQDVGQTTFSMTQGTKPPPTQKDNLILGVSLNQEVGILDFTHSFEYKFIRDDSEAFSKKIHFGTEASLGPLDLRAGLNQGYLSYGVGVDLWLFQIDAAAYTAELGTYSGQSKNDRYSVSLTFELDLDQSFKLKDSNGKKRRLNQRR